MQQHGPRYKAIDTERTAGHSRICAIFTILSSAVFLSGCPDGNLEVPATDPDNQAPVAAAGPNQIVDNLTVVNLDGGGSKDADGDTLAYSWTLVSAPPGSAAQLMAASSVNPNFMPDVVGEYLIRLRVDDGFDATDADSVKIFAEDPGTAPPVANAGPDQQVVFMQGGTNIQLDGRMSSDPDNDPLSYTWEITLFEKSGALDPQAPVVLIGPTTDTPVFDVIAIDQLGTYTIQLTVRDGVLEDTDTVIIEVEKSFPTASVLLGSGLVVGAIFSGRRKRRWKLSA